MLSVQQLLGNHSCQAAEEMPSAINHDNLLEHLNSNKHIQRQSPMSVGQRCAARGGAVNTRNDATQSLRGASKARSHAQKRGKSKESVMMHNRGR
jgi:hypothetical protein